jgi:hypothetical protein
MPSRTSQQLVVTDFDADPGLTEIMDQEMFDIVNDWVSRGDAYSKNKQLTSQAFNAYQTAQSTLNLIENISVESRNQIESHINEGVKALIGSLTITIPSSATAQAMAATMAAPIMKENNSQQIACLRVAPVNHTQSL